MHPATRSTAVDLHTLQHYQIPALISEGRSKDLLLISTPA